MSRARSIWLVARRELLERGRSRGFIFSVLFTTTIIIGSFVVPVLIFGDEGPTRVGVVEPAPDRLDSAITTTAAALDQDIAVVRFSDREAGETALLDDQIAALKPGQGLQPPHRGTAHVFRQAGAPIIVFGLPIKPSAGTCHTYRHTCADAGTWVGCPLSSTVEEWRPKISSPAASLCVTLS